ncbi:MAG TPA: hypothetical protein PK177_08005 [Burkholderiaceae bacterium]|nr:hypothetical protein [Burkholderiaceae bacterium]
MFSEYVTIGAAPGEERCAQLGSDDYEADSRVECTVFKRMLERLFPTDGTAIRYQVRKFPHDFGSYREVVICAPEGTPGFLVKATEVEHNVPVQWDAIARYELCWYATRASFIEAVRSGRMDFSEVPALLLPTTPPKVPADRSLAELLEQFPLAFTREPAPRG